MTLKDTHFHFLQALMPAFSFPTPGAAGCFAHILFMWEANQEVRWGNGCGLPLSNAPPLLCVPNSMGLAGQPHPATWSGKWT